MEKVLAMSRVIWLALLSVLLASAALSAEPIKVGMVNLQRVISESQVGRTAQEKFRAEVKKVEAELLKEKQELELLKGDLEKKSVLLRGEEKLELERQFQRRYRDYVREMQDYQDELRQRENEMTAQILEELRDVVADIGKKEAFTVIFEQSQALFVEKTVDITDRVIQIYDQRNLRPQKTEN